MEQTDHQYCSFSVSMNAAKVALDKIEFMEQQARAFVIPQAITLSNDDAVSKVEYKYDILNHVEVMDILK